MIQMLRKLAMASLFVLWLIALSLAFTAGYTHAVADIQEEQRKLAREHRREIRNRYR